MVWTVLPESRSQQKIRQNGRNVFLVIHLLYILFLMGGALGVLMAFVGMMATISVSCNTNMPVGVRILLNIGILVAFAAADVGIVYLVGGLIGA